MNEPHECEFSLTTDVAVFSCECGMVEVSGEHYYPEERVNAITNTAKKLVAILDLIVDDFENTDTVNDWTIDQAKDLLKDVDHIYLP